MFYLVVTLHLCICYPGEGTSRRLIYDAILNLILMIT